MSVEPLVTFVVPCYKLAHLLPECVNSILKQDYENFEVLIMDNCSPDRTPEVAQSFNDPRIQHIRNESNLGHIRNYNKGMTLARGKYVWLLSADDMLRSPHVLGRFVDVMERNPRVGYVFCRAVELHQGKEKEIVPWADCGDEDCIWNDTSFLMRLIQTNCIVAPTVLMRKAGHDKVGLFQPDLPFASDWYMWCMLAMQYDVAYLSDPMVCYRVHEESLTTLYSRDYARICVGDELTVLWRVGREAELANILSLRGACEAAFLRRAVHLLRAGLQGVTLSISVAEFEEILQSRIGDVEDAKEIRASVYTRLTESVTTLLFRDIPPIALADDLGALWSMGHQAKLAGIPSLREACEAAFFRGAVHLLSAGLQGATPCLSAAEFETILQTRIGNLEDVKHIRAIVYTSLGDRQYCAGEYGQAAQSYWLGLTACPWRMKTWTKYLLLRTGGVGIRIRQLSH
jgi:glycosyltransferase involved in cell wall biosynthesis